MHIFVKTFIIVFLLLPAFTFAATAVVKINTGTGDINALEATLVLPEGLRIEEIQSGNSAVLIWITPPEQTGNVIAFAGITPGGFFGTYPIFTMSGDFNAKDVAKMRFESVNALKNDGSGTPVPVELNLLLSQKKDDQEPPEDFTPVIASDPNVFDGKYFLVFATQDKGGGVAHFQVREGRWGRFREAESPYLLTHQQLDRNIYVKAIDNSGNEKVAVLAARVHKSWWGGAGLFVILTIIVFFAIVYKKTWLIFTK